MCLLYGLDLRYKKKIRKFKFLFQIEPHSNTSSSSTFTVVVETDTLGLTTEVGGITVVLVTQEILSVKGTIGEPGMPVNITFVGAEANISGVPGGKLTRNI